MALLKDYLALKAKFYSPPPGGEGKVANTSGINNIEVDALERAWVPSSGRHDPNLVDSLLKTLDDYLGDRPLPVARARLNMRFQPFVDGSGDAGSWLANEVESQARFMVLSGAFDALHFVMRGLGHPIKYYPDQTMPGFASKVDFTILGGNGKKVLVEVKSPSVLERCLPTLERGAIRIRLNSSSPEEKVLVKVCLHMASRKAHWLAMTSHSKWVFLRLHDNVEDPYITYSTVEQQADNTRPFRALLGMVLAAEYDLDVESNADMTVQLPPTTEECETEADSEEPDQQDEGGPYQGEGRLVRGELAVLRPPKVGRAVTAPGLLVSWAESELRDTRWTSYRIVDGTDWCQSLPYFGAEPVRLRIQRFLGRGSTGTVFEAKNDVVGCSEALQSRSYVLKTVVKGTYEEKEGQIECLFTELKIYGKIEQARRSGKICNAVPRCYGLYESSNILALILDYEGEPLSDAEWSSLEYQEKAEIFNAIQELHEIGVYHHDLEPQNVVRNANGRYKIIDFSFGEMHRCLGVNQMDDSYGDDECHELKLMWRNLMRQR